MTFVEPKFSPVLKQDRPISAEERVLATYHVDDCFCPAARAAHGALQWGGTAVRDTWQKN